jgi:hypothetical protein
MIMIITIHPGALGEALLASNKPRPINRPTQMRRAIYFVKG